jgi:hypothetical protein
LEAVFDMAGKCLAGTCRRYNVFRLVEQTWAPEEASVGGGEAVGASGWEAEWGVDENYTWG